MYKIGEFSVLAKTTVKTLRYYEKEGLLIPSFVDKETGYRYYETNQLVDLAKIISMRQIGLSIDEIKIILEGKEYKTITGQDETHTSDFYYYAGTDKIANTTEGYKMIFKNKANSDNISYWVASRCVYVDSSGVSFCVGECVRWRRGR